MADKKMRLQLDFDADKIYIDDATQQGNVPGHRNLAEATNDVMEACGISAQKLGSMEIDMNEQEVVLTYRISDLEQRTPGILRALGLKSVDMQNSLDILHLFLNGFLPSSVTQKALELEAKEDTPNEDVSEFLRIIREGIKDDNGEASK